MEATGLSFWLVAFYVLEAAVAATLGGAAAVPPEMAVKDSPLLVWMLALTRSISQDAWTAWSTLLLALLFASSIPPLVRMLLMGRSRRVAVAMAVAYMMPMFALRPFLLDPVSMAMPVMVWVAWMLVENVVRPRAVPFLMLIIAVSAFMLIIPSAWYLPLAMMVVALGICLATRRRRGAISTFVAAIWSAATGLGVEAFGVPMQQYVAPHAPVTEIARELFPLPAIILCVLGLLIAAYAVWRNSRLQPGPHVWWSIWALAMCGVTLPPYAPWIEPGTIWMAVSPLWLLLAAWTIGSLASLLRSPD